MHNLEDEINKLIAENSRLLEENKEIIKENQRLKKFPLEKIARFGRLSFGVITSFGLPALIRNYIDRASPTDPFPKEETSKLASALINRWLVGSTLSILFAILPSIFIISQIVLLQKQNHLLSDQIQQNSKQIELGLLPIVEYHHQWSRNLDYYGIQLLNAGNGPATNVEVIQIIVDGKLIEGDNWNAAISLLEIDNSQDWIAWTSGTFTIPAGASINLFGVDDNEVDFSQERKEIIEKALPRLSLIINYCQVYGSKRCDKISFP